MIEAKFAEDHKETSKAHSKRVLPDTILPESPRENDKEEEGKDIPRCSSQRQETKVPEDFTSPRIIPHAFSSTCCDGPIFARHNASIFIVGYSASSQTIPKLGSMRIDEQTVIANSLNLCQSTEIVFGCEAQNSRLIVHVSLVA